MKYIRTFSQLGIHDVPVVGGKNASLGEMFCQLSNSGVRVPDGFATTAEAYWHFIDSNSLRDRINEVLNVLDVNDTDALCSAGQNIRNWITEATIPEDLAVEISQAYEQLAQSCGQTDVAVRSSATAEDLPNASFAGQQETYLNISGNDALLNTCLKVFASLFTDRAIAYRVHQGFRHDQVALSIGVQQMIHADQATSGVIFTLDTESGFEDVVFITSAYGLGENVVQGKVNPDEFYVYKKTLTDNNRPILKRQLGSKAIKMVYSDDPTADSSTHNIAVKREQREVFSISDDEVLELARYAIAIEKHYSDKAGHSVPMDIEWAKDGLDNKLYIVQARPETVQSQTSHHSLLEYKLTSKSDVIATGKSIGNKIASGKARIIADASHMGELKDGEVLITDITDPDWEPVMKRAAAIITNRGGRTCHAAIVARELGIPAVVGCNDATHIIEDDQAVTVSCAEGDSGYIYDGILDYEIIEVDLELKQRPKTKIMLNLGNPEQAFSRSFLPADGVGLARLEFIINNSIRIHPQALLKSGTLDLETQREIESITAGYDNHRDFFIKRLSEGVGTIAAAFYPRPVIVRMSDFKSNEYASLVGGNNFEPAEENPMIGFRGASRYHSKQFIDCFKMECEAIQLVRTQMGLDNVSVMLPFVRSLDEANETLSIMKSMGLERGKDDLKIYLMCEIPANAILADDFLQQFDGFSIGSNDLTQLTLGVDRDSHLVEGFDERNEAVLRLMEMAIDACHRHNKYVGICGQAPSDFPEITRWLVEHKIDSISLTHDSLLDMFRVVQNMENKIKDT